jgi:uncharacterized protein YjiK
MRRVPAAALLGFLVVACAPKPQPNAAVRDSAILAEREARVEQALQHPDTGLSRKPVARWYLPNKLREISGLALTPDGKLFAHNDEVARVFEIDYRRGVLLKDFWVGSPPVRGDFEGITVAPGRMYLLASNGQLLEFQEGADGAHVAYRALDSKLGKECEFEGVAYEPASGGLLLLCKNVGTKRLQGSLVIYRWKPGSGNPPEPLAIPLEKVIGSNPWKGLHPSDITIEPTSGNYVIVAAQEEAMVELTPSGQVRFARPLPGHHRQAEGVAITTDHILLLSDEGGQAQAAITLYRWPLP